MKIFVIGASGLVGSNCVNYFREKQWDVLGTHRSYTCEGTCYYDISQPNDEKNFDVISFAPNVIVHCAALTHVDYCEKNPDESFQQNVKATEHACELALKCGARLVYISTDYVFDGKNGPYRENDDPNPVNIYGKHKLEAEKCVINSKLDHLILRITNVYGNEERGKNFITRIAKQCQENKDIIHLRLPYDQYATPINANDIARALFCLISDKKTGIYHLASTDYMNRVELAKKIVSYFPSVQSMKIDAINTQELKQDAQRPLIGGLLKLKFSSEYPDFSFTNVDHYLSTVVNNIAQ